MAKRIRQSKSLDGRNLAEAIFFNKEQISKTKKRSKSSGCLKSVKNVVSGLLGICLDDDTSSLQCILQPQPQPQPQPQQPQTTTTTPKPRQVESPLASHKPSAHYIQFADRCKISKIVRDEMTGQLVTETIGNNALLMLILNENGKLLFQSDFFNEEIDDIRTDIIDHMSGCVAFKHYRFEFQNPKNATVLMDRLIEQGRPINPYDMSRRRDGNDFTEVFGRFCSIFTNGEQRDSTTLKSLGNGKASVLITQDQTVFYILIAKNKYIDDINCLEKVEQLDRLNFKNGAVSFKTSDGVLRKLKFLQDEGNQFFNILTSSRNLQSKTNEPTSVSTNEHAASNRSESSRTSSIRSSGRTASSGKYTVREPSSNRTASVTSEASGSSKPSRLSEKTITASSGKYVVPEQDTTSNRTSRTSSTRPSRSIRSRYSDHPVSIDSNAPTETHDPPSLLEECPESFSEEYNY